LTDDEIMRKAVEDALDRSDPKRLEERTVWKNTAVLMRFGPSGSGLPAGITIHDLDLPYDPDELALIWLGPAADEESVRFLETLYERAEDNRLKEDALDALGLHTNPALLVPFLDSIVSGAGRSALRESAASILGDQRDERAVAILKQTARTDESVEVRCAAVRALAEARLESADEAVIDIASNAGLRRLREAAFAALAEVAARRALPTPERVLRDDPDLEVRENVIETLADMPDGEGLPLLIETARRHPEPEVRRAAIEALGASGNPWALDCLVALVKGRS
jgi:HEAT repeat protein